MNVNLLTNPTNPDIHQVIIDGRWVGTFLPLGNNHKIKFLADRPLTADELEAIATRLRNLEKSGV